MEEIFVIIQRILAGTALVSFAVAGVVWIVSGRTKRKVFKQEKRRNNGMHSGRNRIKIASLRESQKSI